MIDLSAACERVQRFMRPIPAASGARIRSGPLAWGPMSSVWIGFVGVIVGGLITTLWSWLAVVRQELSDAMVSARLVDDDLAALTQAVRSPDRIPPSQDDGGIWEQNRTALARVLGRRQWDEVSTAYRHHAHPLPEHSLDDDIATARQALAQLISGKRYVISQRWRNLSGR